MNFDPSKMGQRSGQRPANTQNRGPKPRRLFVVVDKYETPENGYHFAVGHEAGSPDKKVRVRLTTVKERLQDRPNEKEEKVKDQYVTGANTRDTLLDKSQAGITLVSFDDARLVSDNDGMAEYRAHWPKTMATSPDAEVMTGLAHVRLREAGEVNGKHVRQQAYVELVKGANEVDGANVADHLLNALAIQDVDGRARDPFAIIRVQYEGKVVASPRLYPATETFKKFDQALGEDKDVTRKVSAETTLASLMAAEPGYNDFANRQLDTARAIVAGLQGADLPKFNTADENVRNDITNLYYGAKQGAFKVDVVGLEKIDFGADSRKTYVKDKDKPQLAAYTIKEPVAGSADHVRESAGFTQTVLAVLRHEDGEPFAIFASPSEMYPKVKKFNDLQLDATTDATLEASTKIEQEAAHEAEEQEPEYAGTDFDDDVAF